MKGQKLGCPKRKGTTTIRTLLEDDHKPWDFLGGLILRLQKMGVHPSGPALTLESPSQFLDDHDGSNQGGVPKSSLRVIIFIPFQTERHDWLVMTGT